MIDSILAHKIVDSFRGQEITPSDVLEALVTYEHKLGLESLQSELTKVKEQRDSLIRWFEIHKNCENCRHEFDDKNSPCELCKDYLAWESNFGEIGRVTNEY